MQNKNENFHDKPKDILLMPDLVLYYFCFISTINNSRVITIAEQKKEVKIRK